MGHGGRDQEVRFHVDPDPRTGPRRRHASGCACSTAPPAPFGSPTRGAASGNKSGRLDGISEAAVEAAGSAERVRGRLRVNVDPSDSRLVLAVPLSGFLSTHREPRLEIVMRDHVGDLVADGLDAALRLGDLPDGSFTVRKRLDTRPDDGPADNLAEHGRPGHPSDLPNHECIDD